MSNENVELNSRWEAALNKHISAQEEMETYLSKATALAFFTVYSDDFFDLPKEIAQDYLWTLFELIEKTQKANLETLLSLLEEQKVCQAFIDKQKPDCD